MKNILLLVCLIVNVLVVKGDCSFPKSWVGRWFQSGVSELINITETHIQFKGNCSESVEDGVRYLLYNGDENCTTCIHFHTHIYTDYKNQKRKVESVLPYQQSHCSNESQRSLCDAITNKTYYMIQKEPRPMIWSCDFSPLPMNMSYNRKGYNDSWKLGSKASSCSNRHSMLLQYKQWAHDNMRFLDKKVRLDCLALWAVDATTHFIVGKLRGATTKVPVTEIPPRNITDEDSYRCFMFDQRRVKDGNQWYNVTYHLAQSADAACNGLVSPTNGTITMVLTGDNKPVDRQPADPGVTCNFPKWMNGEWMSLELEMLVRTEPGYLLFQVMPSLLKGKSPDPNDPEVPEIRIWCHSIVEEVEGKRIKSIGYLVTECSGGYVPLEFSLLSDTVAQMPGSVHNSKDTPEEVTFGEISRMEPLTLIPSQHLRRPRPCPESASGHYSVISTRDISDRLKRVVYENPVPNADVGYKSALELVANNYINISIGCEKQARGLMEFKADNFTTEFECFAGWEHDGAQYSLAMPKTTPDQKMPPVDLCFVYEHENTGKSTLFMGVTARCEKNFPANNAWKIGFYLALTGETCGK